MQNINKVIKEERNLESMRDKKILLKLADILLQEKLINIDEKVRLEKVIQEGHI